MIPKDSVRLKTQKWSELDECSCSPQTCQSKAPLPSPNSMWGMNLETETQSMPEPLPREAFPFIHSPDTPPLAVATPLSTGLL